MVDQLDVYRTRGLAELAGHLHVSGAGGGITTGVIVRAGDGAGAFANGRTKDFPRVGEGGGGTAGADLDAFNEPVFPVEAEHPEFFDLEADGERPDVACNQLGTIQERVIAQLLGDDADRDLHDSDQLERFDMTDALELAEVFFLPVGQAGE